MIYDTVSLWDHSTWTYKSFKKALNRTEGGRACFGLGGGALAAVSSPPTLSETSESHVRTVRSCRASRDRVGPNGPAGSAVADRRPSYPYRFRLERAASRGATGLGARCPAAAGAAPGRVCTAGPSRSGITDRPVGGIKFLSADSARNKSWIYVPRNLMSVGLTLAPILAAIQLGLYWLPFHFNSDLYTLLALHWG